MKKPLIILTGPTAAGKTSASIKLAKKVDGEIISADSMQVYKGMDVGTAKITPQEMDGVPHYLVDEISPDTSFHVYEFKKMAESYMEQIYAKGKIPVIVGGTGFYIQALLYDVDFCEEESDRTYRIGLEKLAAEKGAGYLHDMLKEVDSVSGAGIHPNNVKRVIRALEYYHETGSPISEHNLEQRAKESPYNFLYIVLTMDREKLYERINHRVDMMVSNGLFQEMEELIRKGYTKDLTSMQAIGYKELFSYFEGIASYEDTIAEIKRDTRHFAKRQLTWFRREREVVFIDKDEFQGEDACVDEILRLADEKKIL